MATQLGLAVWSWPTGGGGIPPPFVLPRFRKEVGVIRRLSIFVDESGDFGNIQPHSPYYLVTMLFHDQDKDIAFDNAALDTNIRAIGFDPLSLHTGPIIRREGYYRGHVKDMRKKLLRSLLAYCQYVPIRYTTMIIEKKRMCGSY